MEIRGTSKVFSDWSDRHALSLRRCVRREAERISRARRMHEEFEREETRRIARTMDRVRGSKPSLTRKRTCPEAAPSLLQRVGVSPVGGVGTRPTIPGKLIRRGCSLQLVSSPCFVAPSRIESKDNRVRRLAHATIPLVSDPAPPPSNPCLVPDNSRAGTSLDAGNRSGLDVPQITIRTATPECGRGGGGPIESENVSLTHTATKYQQSKNELNRLINETENN
ncbi:uncharacterized protein [Oscarella lobularis]|uniref:uncharacterized protein n=1 Tax=Oscarella lobularis TaxID=121494 RepID=UPI0033136CB3